MTARVRTVDSAQYEYRLKQFDFDMTVAVFAQSLSPGNEQMDFWASDRADTPGSRNLAGVRDPVVDRLIALLIAAPDLAITKTDGLLTVVPGQTLTYTLTISNVGNQDATGVTVMVHLAEVLRRPRHEARPHGLALRTVADDR